MKKTKNINLQLFAEKEDVDVEELLKKQELEIKKDSEIKSLEKQLSELTTKVSNLETDKKMLVEANQKMFAQLPVGKSENVEEMKAEETLTFEDITKNILEERKK